MTAIIGNPTILIVDDTSGNLGVVVNLLEGRGYRVAIAQDGEEGLQRAQLVQPDLILLDVMMPGIDGFETCNRLKKQQSTRDIPVIFMTASASSEHKVKGFQAGAVDYVTKPLQIDEVLARVDTHLKLHAAQKRLEEQNALLDKYREELEQRVAERTAELEAREREFRTLAENQPDSLARYDKQCRTVYVNQQLENCLGKKIDTLRGKTPLELVPSELFVEYQAHLAQTIATGLPSEMELVLPDNGEGVRYHYIRFVAERDANGEIVGALTIGRDITERKQAERELQLLNSAVNASTEAVFLMNAQGRFVYVNEEACRSLGYSREKLLTMKPSDIDPDITADELGRLLDSIFTNGPKESPKESRHRASDGQMFPIEIAASPIKLEGENYCLTMVRDISERKRAESALRESEQRYREIFENVTDSLYLIEVTQEGHFRSLAFNAAFEKSTGIPRDALIGRMTGGMNDNAEVESVLHDEATRTIINKYRHCVNAGEIIEEDSVLDMPTGLRFYHLTLVPLRDETGRICRILGVARDVTELKQAAHDLQESRTQLRGLTAQREAAREEERKRIAREVHDELGQILTGLKLNVSVLVHKLSAGQELTKEKLQETMMLTDRALEVARNVASALRPSALEMGIVSALEWLAGRFGANTGIRCEVHIDDDDMQLDEARAIALFRIVQESLTNVARYAKAERVDVSLSREADDYVLKVRDNGGGFDASVKKTDSFGLVGIRERALMLGGAVDIDSRPGKGTEIVVRIPVQSIAEES